jgi:hypothetical protein
LYEESALDHKTAKGDHRRTVDQLKVTILTSFLTFSNGPYLSFVYSMKQNDNEMARREAALLTAEHARLIAENARFRDEVRKLERIVYGVPVLAPSSSLPSINGANNSHLINVATTPQLSMSTSPRPGPPSAMSTLQLPLSASTPIPHPRHLSMAAASTTTTPQPHSTYLLSSQSPRFPPPVAPAVPLVITLPSPMSAPLSSPSGTIGPMTSSSSHIMSVQPSSFSSHVAASSVVASPLPTPQPTHSGRGSTNQ